MVGKGALAPCPPSIQLVVGRVGTRKPVIGRAFARPGGLPTPRTARLAQSFLNTIDAIHPVISAMKAVISP
jgi:hypothetical protein